MFTPSHIDRVRRSVDQIALTANMDPDRIDIGVVTLESHRDYNNVSIKHIDPHMSLGGKDLKITAGAGFLEQASDDILDVTIAHEIAHFVLGHLSKSIITTSLEESKQDEFDADQLAVELTGKLEPAISLLESSVAAHDMNVARLPEDERPFVAYPHPHERIKRLIAHFGAAAGGQDDDPTPAGPDLSASM